MPGYKSVPGSEEDEEKEQSNWMMDEDSSGHELEESSRRQNPTFRVTRPESSDMNR